MERLGREPLAWRVLPSPVMGEASYVAVNVFENPNELVVLAAMPGVAPEDISVKLEGGFLRLRSRERGEHAEDKYLFREWSYGPYERDVELPRPVDGQSATVTFGNGVLSVVVPKSDTFVDAELSLDKVGQARGSSDGHRAEASGASSRR